MVLRVGAENCLRRGWRTIFEGRGWFLIGSLPTGAGACEQSQYEIQYLMHVISRKAVQQFWGRYPDSERPLVRWFKIMQKIDFASFNELPKTFPSADKVGDLIVFNLGGNKYRLIAAIHFNRRKVFIRHVLTHPQYDKGALKK